MYAKWHKPTRNISVGDIVVLHYGNLVLTKWSLGKVLKTFSGSDGLVRVKIKIQSGTFTRPVNKNNYTAPTP